MIELLAAGGCGRPRSCEVETRGGGSGCNLAIDMKKLDPAMPVETIGLVGDDEDGRFLLAEADEHGIDRTRRCRSRRRPPTQYTDAYRLAPDRAAHAHLLPGHGSPPDARIISTSPAPRAASSIWACPGVHRRMDAPWGERRQRLGHRAQAGEGGRPGDQPRAGEHRARRASPALARPCLPHLDLPGRQRLRDRRHRRRADVPSGDHRRRGLHPRRPPCPGHGQRCSLVVVHFPAGRRGA